MGILLGFAPFIAFAILDWVMGPTQGLIAGALVSLALAANAPGPLRLRRALLGKALHVRRLHACQSGEAHRYFRRETHRHLVGPPRPRQAAGTAVITGHCSPRVYTISSS